MFVWPAGGFVVVWDSNGQDGDRYGVYGRRYGADGSPVGSEVQINQHTVGEQYVPAVAGAPDGRFVVVWQSDGQDGHNGGVFGLRYDAGGIPVGGEFQVNDFAVDDQREPDIAMDDVGGFVVAWASYSQDGDGSGIFARRFDSGANPLGGEFQVNKYTADHQVRPRIAMAPDGRFVVVWKSAGGQDGEATGIFGQKFTPDGQPLGLAPW